MQCSIFQKINITPHPTEDQYQITTSIDQIFISRIKERFYHTCDCYIWGR